MKLATWNVNSLAVRLPQVLDWLAANPVDVLALQELKLTDDKFPHAALAEAGYQSLCFGQKTYNGVALLSRAEGGQVQRNIPGFEDPMARIIAATYQDAALGAVRVVGGISRTGRPPTATSLSTRCAGCRRCASGWRKSCWPIRSWC